MNINWGAVGALAGWTALLASGFAFLVRSIVSEEIRKLNGYYVRETLCQERMDAHREELQQYAKIIVLTGREKA